MPPFLSRFLRRTGLAGPLGAFARSLSDANVRERNRIIAADLAQSATDLAPLFRGRGRTGNKTLWVISTMGAPWSYKLESILARGLEAEGYRAVMVWPFFERWRAPYHRLFGFDRALDFTRFLAAEPPASAEAEMAPYRNAISTKELLAMTYHGVDIGRIALSNILYRNKFSKLELQGAAALAAVTAELAAVKRNVHAAEKMLAAGKPDLGLIVEKGVSPQAEIFGVCVANDVPVIQYANSQHINSYAVKRYTKANRHQHTFSLSEKSWAAAQAMPWNDAAERELLDEFEASYRGGRWFGRKFLHQGKEVKTADAARQQLGLDPAKKTAVVFSHVLWDATFFFGESLFENYETWLAEVVKAAYANPAVNWVIKLHPDLVWKLKMENFNGELRDLLVIRDAAGKVPDHIKIVLPDTDIDTLSFFDFTDYCLTVRGTIGIEMACRGIPVLTAGTGRYSGHGFTVDSPDTKTYLDRLARIQDQPPMAAAERERARRFAFTLFKMRPWTLRSFRIESLGMEKAGHPLGMNVRPEPAARAAGDVADLVDIRAFARWAASGDEDYRVAFEDRVPV